MRHTRILVTYYGGHDVLRVIEEECPEPMSRGSTTMKILAAADLHGIRPVYDWLLLVAREHRVDAIVLAGDLLGCPDGFDTPEAAQEFEADGLAALLGEAAAPVLYIMGNDDLVELPSRSDRVRSLHGHRVSCGAFNFVGYQYSLPFMGGTFEKSDEGIADDLTSLAPVMDDDTILVSHTPMHGVLDPGIGETRIGSVALREFLDLHPCRAHIHGHSHAGFGRSGKHFNVASAGRARAMLIDLATMQHEVVTTALPGRRQVG